MIKLIITDLDGTFLNSEGNFDRDYYQKIKNLMDDKEIAFAPCTGKQCDRVVELFGDKESESLWILGDSASRIKHQRKYVYESLLPNKLGLAIIAKLEKIADDLIIIACTSKTALIKESISPAETKVVRGSYTSVATVKNLQDITDDFVKITIFDPQKRSFETVKQLTEFKDKAYLVASEASWIDITNHGVHKGTTVKQLQDILGITHSETMVFGDGLNDIELMEAAEYSFAVGNAFPETKAKAAFITKTNDENGVLSTIERILNLQA
ncbi:MAG: HAD-IIB family hydrolase [Micrococcaceae bacterium]